MKCLKCNTNEASFDPRFGYLPCSACQKRDAGTQTRELPRVVHPAHRERIIRENEPYMKDWLQPYGFDGKPSREYAKSYPAHVKDQYTEDEIKSMDL